MFEFVFSFVSTFTTSFCSCQSFSWTFIVMRFNCRNHSFSFLKFNLVRNDFNCSKSIWNDFNRSLLKKLVTFFLYSRFSEIIKSDRSRQNYWKKRIHLSDRFHFETDDLEKLREFRWKKCKFLLVDRFLLHMFIFWMSMLLNICSIRFANQINHIYRHSNLSKQKHFHLIIRKQS
jgi:hypothetical protein